MTPSTVQYHAQKTARKAAGLCGMARCPNSAARGYSRCDTCLDDRRRRTDRIEARTGSRRMAPEWQIREIEEQRKWNAEHIHTEAK